MDDELAFLITIAARPDNDLARLVFADWLDDHEQPDRAEFIRLSVAAADPAVPPEARAASQALADELLAAHHTDWERPLTDLGVALSIDFTPMPCVTYDRGVPSQVCMPWQTFLAAGGRLHDAAPTVTGLDFDYQRLWHGNAAQLAACPHLSHFSDLSLMYCNVDAAGVAALAASPHLAGLRRLDLRGNPLGVEGIRALWESPHFPADMALALTGRAETPFADFRRAEPPGRGR